MKRTYILSHLVVSHPSRHRNTLRIELVATTKRLTNDTKNVGKLT
jgi:hypothetical protein